MKENIVHIPVNKVSIEGNLEIPQEAKGLVIFSHGSGSSRFSPRNKAVAKVLQKAGLETLLLDLLTREEDQVYENRFDINLLTDRLVHTINWLEKESPGEMLSLGLFGASTGAASALSAAAFLGPKVKAVVSRGGRPDLVMDILGKVVSPTLLIVGGEDEVVIELNRQAYEKLQTTKTLEIIPGATHLFEEPGALEEVARLASDWFKKYL
ncbi:MAG TPA: dienelactone hydrolase family protein [Clostridia bacterium]|nr:dienelactone hydrolase family protein [Clostridia bacterium]